jgi:uncharacterized protein YciI
MRGKQLFLLTLSPSRPNFIETLTEDEKEKISEHFEYFKLLMEKDVLFMAGRTDSASLGLGMLFAKNHTEALNIVKADPAIIAGVFYYNIETFSIALLNGRLTLNNE